MEIALGGGHYPDYQASARLWHGLLERVRALPGVEAAGTVSDLPLRGETMKGYHETPLAVEGRPPEVEEASPMVGMRLFTPGYFKAMGIPVVTGRGLDLQGRADEATPVLVSGALARRFFPQETAIGKRVGPRRLSSPRDWNTVVGVVGDVRDFAIQEQPKTGNCLTLSGPKNGGHPNAEKQMSPKRTHRVPKPHYLEALRTSYSTAELCATWSRRVNRSRHAEKASEA